MYFGATLPRPKEASHPHFLNYGNLQVNNTTAPQIRTLASSMNVTQSEDVYSVSLTCWISSSSFFLKREGIARVGSLP
jgi:alpha-tubulin suppressor-like RCC1 family protein